MLRYLQLTKKKKITYRADGNKEILGYADASHGPNKKDNRSVTGWIFLLFGGPICWHSKKQIYTALSATEAELVTLADATTQAIWIRNLTIETKIFSPKITISMFCDNRGAILLSQNANFSFKTRHVILKYAIIKERIDPTEISVSFVRSCDMLADFLTKCLSSTSLNQFLSKINLN